MQTYKVKGAGESWIEAKDDFRVNVDRYNPIGSSII